jgi:hypothetical protein
MSLEGLRAWVAEVERKLAKRTRVFLALSVIAIGIAGAAVYLAIDARNSSVSESDVQALQEELEERIDGGGAGAALMPPIEPEPAPTPETSPQPGSGHGNNGGGGNGSNGASDGGGAGTGGASDSAKLQELLQQAKERSAENE